MALTGILLMGCGVLYIVKPDIFRRGIWLKTDIFQRILSPESYITFMRIAGAVIFLIGLIVLLRG